MFDLGTVFITISWILNVYSLIPQILLNYRTRFARGISDLMLLGNMNMVLCGVIFIFGSNLPFIYKFMGSLGCSICFVMLAQRIFYHWPESIEFVKPFAGNLLIYVCLLPFIIQNAGFFGFICGWIGVGVQFLYMIPQMIKIIQTKSVKGFSFTFLTLLATAFSFELMGALLLELPYSIVVNDIRGIVVYLIFCGLFLKYGKS